jgi:soluble lytic murein transglycosylase-like protein
VKIACLTLMLFASSCCWARTAQDSRKEAEYYVAVYARNYRVPVDFVRAVIEQESNWQPCAISRKGAVGLMQLMPSTASSLGVTDRCDVRQNVSAGVRHLARLMNRFHGDLRLVAAAYYAGEHVVDTYGLGYANPDVVTYVASVRERMERQIRLRSAVRQRAPGRRR